MSLRDIVFGIFIVSVFFAASCYVLEWEDDASEAYGKVDGDDDGYYIDEYGLTWIAIPEGSFQMGCVAADDGCDTRETPQHEVILSAFEMTETEITVAEYQEVIGRHENENSTCIDDECPAVFVYWWDAVNFCDLVGGRLPTEAEWEYAARAGTKTVFICGNDSSCLDAFAWYGENSDGNLQPVGEKEPNAFGLFDMSGNALEWVYDWMDDNYYEDETIENPTGPGNGDTRVKRGGNFGDSDHWALRLSARDSTDPNDNADYLGFRCVKSDVSVGDDDADDDDDDDDDIEVDCDGIVSKIYDECGNNVTNGEPLSRQDALENCVGDSSNWECWQCCLDDCWGDGDDCNGFDSCMTDDCGGYEV